MSRHAITPPSRWTTVHTLEIPTRPSRVVSADTLPVDPRLAEWLAAVCPGGVYTHQGAAITAAVEGRDVCLVTGTASGKTLAFHAAALESLVKDPEARVIAIYPQKSLASQQLDRWAAVLDDFGLHAPVRIDGDVPVAERTALLDTARVAVMTPDVLHSWLMASLGSPVVRRFVRGVTLLILDELHVYTGVMGTNSAYLLRRLQHAHLGLGGRGIRFFAASATIREPARHMELLTGRGPQLVGEEEDGSPRHPVTMQLIQAPAGTDWLRELSQLVREILLGPARFLMFCDSRKQTEMVATMLQPETRDTAEDRAEADDELPLRRPVLPYRAGYEARHRKQIERALQQGQLRGVVCTSAMELGLDIPGLDLAVLVGVPNSATSLRQRIGRIGRSAPGTVWIVDTGTQLDRAVFRDPSSLLTRPPVEGALYLENPNIQYMQAVCLGRRVHGEHDVIHSQPEVTRLDSPIAWPAGFLALCGRERADELTAEQRTMRNAAEDRPHQRFPLRDTGLSFRIDTWSGRTKIGALGSGLTYAQLMREAYPGAVYLHSTVAYRVMSVGLQQREVRVRRERKYTFTTPLSLPGEVQPNLTAGSLHRVVRSADGALMEADAYVRETITGYSERRGGAVETHAYPNEYHRRPYFSRHFNTTAVLLWIPAFDGEEPGRHGAVSALADLLFESLLGIAPFERMDLGVSVTRYRGTTGHLPERARFIAIYDQTVGSLRLSGRLIDAVLSGQLVRQARWLFESQEAKARNPEVGVLLDALAVQGDTWREGSVEPDEVLLDEAEDLVPVLAPGSLGFKVDEQYREVRVEDVVYIPRFGALMYRYTIPEGRAVRGQTLMTPITHVVGIPDLHTVTHYNMLLGKVA